MTFFKEQTHGWYIKIPIVVCGFVLLGIVGNYLN